jgi:hypothetical protein
VLHTEDDVRNAMRGLSNEKLAAVWEQTEQQPASAELAMTRGWLIDELETRMSEADFDCWIYGEADGTQASPAAFLTI